MQQQLKLIKNLLETRKARRKEKLFVVEGVRMVEEAGARVKTFFYSENLPIVKKLEEQMSVGYKVSKKQLAEISQVETPQGIVAIVREQEYTLDQIDTKGVIVYCLGVQDPGNLGTIIRTADAFGASGVILSKGTVDLYNPKVVRATMGSLFHLPIVIVENDEETIAQLKQKNVKIIATDLKAEKIATDGDYRGGVAFLVGNEGSGLLPGIVAQGEAVKIPMPGNAESLNVAVSTAILLYEAVRQREHAGKN
ncbi:MAG: RNA methyltransferase [Candidatus Margulisbacteria bacterium]|nr:RNA methyltransferase [Candidatus Margulisiibacteriota bacterium]MBU1617293.1 RNA methyltransferase [Candidatus Margulisiibacteriota bacterium]